MKKICAFSKKEYGQVEPLALYAVDCGWHDTTNDVMLEEKEGKLFLTFYDNIRGLKSTKVIKKFELVPKKVKEECIEFKLIPKIN